MAPQNPWGLTPREADAMDALIQAGNYKRGCDLIGVGQKTFEVHIGQAKAKMGSRNAVHHVLLWDRWRREGTHVRHSEPA